MVGGKAVYQAYIFPAAVVQGVVKIVGEIIISSCGGNACQAAFYKYSFLFKVDTVVGFYKINHTVKIIVAQFKHRCTYLSRIKG